MQGQVRPVQRVPRLLHGRGGLQDPQPPGVHLTGLPASSRVGWLGSLSDGLPRAGRAGRPAPGAPPASAAYHSGHSPALSALLAAQLLVTGGGFQCSLSWAVPVFPVSHCTHSSWVCTCCEGFLEAGEIVCDPLH